MHHSTVRSFIFIIHLFKISRLIGVGPLFARCCQYIFLSELLRLSAYFLLSIVIHSVSRKALLFHFLVFACCLILIELALFLVRKKSRTAIEKFRETALPSFIESVFLRLSTNILNGGDREITIDLNDLRRVHSYLRYSDLYEILLIPCLIVHIVSLCLTSPIFLPILFSFWFVFGYPFKNMPFRKHVKVKRPVFSVGVDLSRRHLLYSRINGFEVYLVEVFLRWQAIRSGAAKGGGDVLVIVQRLCFIFVLVLGFLLAQANYMDLNFVLATGFIVNSFCAIVRKWARSNIRDPKALGVLDRLESDVRRSQGLRQLDFDFPSISDIEFMSEKFFRYFVSSDAPLGVNQINFSIRELGDEVKLMDAILLMKQRLITRFPGIFVEIKFLSSLPYLYPGSIKSNICVGRSDPGDCNLLLAIKACGLDLLISELPRGVDTDVYSPLVLSDIRLIKLICLARCIIFFPNYVVVQDADIGCMINDAVVRERFHDDMVRYKCCVLSLSFEDHS